MLKEIGGHLRIRLPSSLIGLLQLMGHIWRLVSYHPNYLRTLPDSLHRQRIYWPELIVFSKLIIVHFHHLRLVVLSVFSPDNFCLILLIVVAVIISLKRLHGWSQFPMYNLLVDIVALFYNYGSLFFGLVKKSFFFFLFRILRYCVAGRMSIGTI